MGSVFILGAIGLVYSCEEAMSTATPDLGCTGAPIAYTNFKPEVATGLALGPGVSPRFYFWEYVGKPKNTVIYSSFRGSPRPNRATSWVAFKKSDLRRDVSGKNCGRALLNFAYYGASCACHLGTRSEIIWFGQGCCGNRTHSKMNGIMDVGRATA